MPCEPSATGRASPPAERLVPSATGSSTLDQMSFVLQMSSQSHAYRMAQYFNRRHDLNTFPLALFPLRTGLGVEAGSIAVDAGGTSDQVLLLYALNYCLPSTDTGRTTSDQAGRALVVVSNASCAPQAVLAWLSQTSQTIEGDSEGSTASFSVGRYVQRAFFFPQPHRGQSQRATTTAGAEATAAAAVLPGCGDPDTKSLAPPPPPPPP
jgi:hypothetical protein